MTAPIPLASPDGTVYTYACGLCHNVSAGSTISGGRDGVLSLVEHRREHAAACCLCRRCGAEYQGYDYVCEACRPAEDTEQERAMAQRDADREVREGKQAACLATAKDKDAALCLISTLEDISEEHYCAGWMSGIEFEVWAFVQAGVDARYGFLTITADELTRLRDLAEKAGGWCAWDDGIGGVVFVPMAEWVRGMGKVAS